LEKTLDAIKKQFKSSVKWNLSGSLIFEFFHISFHFMLLGALGSRFYGLMGALFSLVYLPIYLSDFGFITALPAYVHTLTESKKNLRTYFLSYVATQFPFIALGIAITFGYYATFFSSNSLILPALALTILLTLSEGLRMFLRFFLHTQFFNKQVIFIELFFMLLYMAAVVGPYYLFGSPILVHRIFYYYFANSIASNLYFSSLVFRLYKTLPNIETDPPKDFLRTIAKNRIFNHSIHVGKHLISGEFLVPLFAVRFGLKEAGFLKLATTVAHSIKALVKSAIHFSGSAFLTKLKKHYSKTPSEAFQVMGASLNKLIYVIIIVLVVNYRPIKMLLSAYYPNLKTAFIYLFMFIIITLLQQLAVAYEQFYLVENATQKLFYLKLFEGILFLGIAVLSRSASPTILLSSIVLVQLVSFSLIATHAYAKWKLKPYTKISLLSISKAVIFSAILSFVLSLATQ
jgi:hypothetical protein